MESVADTTVETNASQAWTAPLQYVTKLIFWVWLASYVLQLSNMSINLKSFEDFQCRKSNSYI